MVDSMARPRSRRHWVSQMFWASIFFDGAFGLEVGLEAVLKRM